MIIYHTNDLHNRLNPAQAERLRGLKLSTPNCLLLDCGDAIWSGNIYFRPDGEPILKLMNHAGYDAMTMGNREFHFSSTGLKKKTGWAAFPVLSANIRPKDRAALPTVSYLQFNIGGRSVVVFGLTVPMITERMLSRRVSSYLFDDPIETASNLVPQLRSSADILIALTHIGINRDRKLAECVRGIDLIIGGHSHTALERPEFVGKTAIVQAGAFARYAGKTEIGEDGRITGELISL